MTEQHNGPQDSRKNNKKNLPKFTEPKDGSFSERDLRSILLKERGDKLELYLRSPEAKLITGFGELKRLYLDGKTEIQRAEPFVRELSHGVSAYLVRPGIDMKIVESSLSLCEQIFPREPNSATSMRGAYQRGMSGTPYRIVSDESNPGYGGFIEGSANFIYLQEGKVIGFSGVYRELHFDPSYYFGQRFGVAEDKRAKPAMAAITLHVADVLSRHSPHQDLYLFTDGASENNNVKRFYDKMGGKVVATAFESSTGDEMMAAYYQVDYGPGSIAARRIEALSRLIK